MLIPLADLVFRVSHENHNSCGSLTIHIEQWDAAKDEPKMLWSFDSPFAQFKMKCHFSADFEGSYAHAWGFTPASTGIVAFRDVRDHGKLLGRIEKTLEKLSEEWGNPESFGAQLVHLSKALGVKAFCWQGRFGWRRTELASDAKSHVDAIIRDFHEEHPKPTRQLEAV